MNFRVEALGASGPGSGPFSRFHLEQAVVFGFESWWAGAHSQILASHFAEDAVIVNHCPKHLSSFGGTHSGHTDILNGFRALEAEFRFADPHVTSILTDGFHVVLGYSILSRHVGTGRAGRICGMAHVTLDADARIKRIENFFDTAALAEVGEMLEDFAARSEALDRVRRMLEISSRIPVPRAD